MNRSRPAVRAALEWISSRQRAGELRPGEELPSIRQMAQACGVSTVSMHKAVRSLRTSGAVLAGPRKRAVLASDGNLLPFGSSGYRDRAAPSSPASRIESQLHRAILLGEIGEGASFPSSKELRRRFHATQRTIRSALRRLYENGIIEPEKRWFRVRHPGLPHANARVALIGFSTGPSEPIIRGFHDPYLCSLLQWQTSRRNLALDQVGVPPGPDVTFHGLDRRRTFTFDDSVIGCILLLNQQSPLWRSLFSRLTGLRIPSAVIDEFGTWKVRDSFPSPGRLRIFAFTTGRLAAAEVTRTLLRRGHRHIAYISPYATASWSIARRDAIREELTRAGLGRNFVLLDFDMNKEMHRFFPDVSAEEIHRHTVGSLRKFPEVVQGAYTRMVNAATWEMSIIEEAVEQQLRPRLEALCERSEVTAWVTVNDSCAAIALRVLRASHRRVGADVSLVSFDNSPGTQDLRIASYDFNAPGCVSSVLNFLTSSYDSRRLFAAERTEIPGMLVERESLGAAPEGP